MPCSCATRLAHGLDQRAMLRRDPAVIVDVGCRLLVRRRQLFVQATGDQVGDDLGVGRRVELVALALQAAS